MEAIIDPDKLECIGFVQTGTVLYNSWSSCILIPVDDSFVNQPLKVEKNGDKYILSVDGQAKLEQAWKDLRFRRNQLLRDSDWTQMPDSPLSQDVRSRWTEYRQKLRDLPKKMIMTTIEDFDTLSWPSCPSTM